MDNLAIYNKYKSVPDSALKNFNNGKFSGTDINPMWRIRCLTEEFGPVGKGWYYEIVRLWTEPVANDEILAMAHVKLFVKYGDEWSKPIEGTGGNIITRYSKKSDTFDNSDEGYKMAITDALSVCCKCLGIGADVWWKEEKTKYTATETPQEKQPIKRATPKPQEYPLQVEEQNAPTRKDAVLREQKKSGIPNENIKRFMGMVQKSKFDELTEKEFTDLLNTVKRYGQ